MSGERVLNNARLPCLKELADLLPRGEWRCPILTGQPDPSNTRRAPSTTYLLSEWVAMGLLEVDEPKSNTNSVEFT